MQQWEYKVVDAGTIVIGSGQKLVESLALDPDVDWFKSSELTDHYNERWALVGGSDRGFWTSISKCLREFGADGWELVGTTPPRYLPGGSATLSQFCLLFKRPLLS